MKSFSLLSAFRRMEQLLISYALGTKSAARINWLQEQIRLCRIRRAMTTVLVVTSLEFYVIRVHYYNMSRNIIGSFIPALLSILALFVTSRAYSRFCKTLFATVYTQVRSEQEQKEDQKVPELQT